MRLGLMTLAVALIVVVGTDSRGEDKPQEAKPASSKTQWAIARAERWEKLLKKEKKSHGKRATALERALAWLANNQSDGGLWEAENYGRVLNGKPVSKDLQAEGRGHAIYDTGVTGLALTAFLVAGYDGRGAHRFDQAVRRALAHMVAIQTEDGCFGERTQKFRADGEEGSKGPLDPRAWSYTQAIVTTAIVEAYGMTGDKRWRASAQKGLHLIAKMRNPEFAWRYGERPISNDTSVSSWMALCLGTAKAINAGLDEAQKLELDAGAEQGFAAWLEKITYEGRAGYRIQGKGSVRPKMRMGEFPPAKTRAMTAAALAGRLTFLRESYKSKLVKLGVKEIAKMPPAWEYDGSIDFIYWYFGSLVMARFTDRTARLWLKALYEALLQHQMAPSEPEAIRGSWDPDGAWGREGGRVYATAVAALMLMCQTRFARR